MLRKSDNVYVGVRKAAILAFLRAAAFLTDAGNVESGTEQRFTHSGHFCSRQAARPVLLCATALKLFFRKYLLHCAFASGLFTIWHTASSAPGSAGDIWVSGEKEENLESWTSS